MSSGEPLSNWEFLRALGGALIALLASAVVLVVGFIGFFPIINPDYLPEREAATAYTLRGKDFTPVVFADGGYDGDASVIIALAEGRPDDQAILMRKLRLPASDYAFLRYHLEGRHPGLRVMLFWKTVDGGETPFYTEMDNPGNGPQYHNLRRSEEWQGTITELAIGFFGDLRGQDIRLEGVRLEPYSASGLLGVVWDEWTAFSPWDQTSINRYVGVPEGALVYPALAAILWLAFAVIVMYGWKRARRRQLRPLQSPSRPAIYMLTGLVWLGLHGLWLHKSWLQNQETRYLFHGKSLHERRLADWDGEYYALAVRVREALPKTTERVGVIFGNVEVAEPLAQRLRYHLMPDIELDILYPTALGRQKLAARNYPFLVIVRDFYGAPNDALSLLPQYGHPLQGGETVLLDTSLGALLRLKPANKPATTKSD
jgi:hypothetical protein